MPGSSLPMEYSDSILLPKTYDIIWSLVPLLFLFICWVAIAVIERKRGSSWPAVILWCLLTVVLPFAGFFIWLVHLAVKYPRSSPAGATTSTRESTAEV